VEENDETLLLEAVLEPEGPIALNHLTIDLDT